MLWVDAAKGLSIILVVLLHTSAWFTDGKGFGHSYVLGISRSFQPLRMPLFFLISGMLIAGAIFNDHPKIAWRAVSLMTVYVFWTVLHASRLALFPGLAPDLHFSAALFLWSVAVPGIYWYIWALPLYYALAALLTVPARKAGLEWLLYAGLAVSATGCLFWSEIATFLTQAGDLKHRVEFNFIASAVRSLFWFMAGVVFSHRIKALVNRAPSDGAAPILAGAALVALGMYIASFGPAFEHLVAPFAMVTGTLVLLRRAGSIMPVRVCEFIGTRTLPIYIFHLLLLNVLSFAVGRFRVAGPFSETVGIVAPLVMTIALIPACILIEMILRRIRLGVLLDGLPGLRYKPRS